MNAMSQLTQLILGIILVVILIISLILGFYDRTAGAEVNQLKILTGVACVGSLYLGSILKAKNQN